MPNQYAPLWSQFSWQMAEDELSDQILRIDIKPGAQVCRTKKPHIR
jgi:hypothetical protein